MKAEPKFMAPGADGELAPGASIWRKGLVYTTNGSFGRASGHSYRISVGFKRGVASTHAASGFHDVYRRVVTVASQPRAWIMSTMLGRRREASQNTS